MPSSAQFKLRRLRLFLILSGIFFGTLAILNVVGISRFIDLSFNVFGVNIPMVLAVGVLPYPVTFLCTDIVSELYGRKRATDMVWVGFIINVWVMFFLWLGGALPGFETIDPTTGQPMLDEAGREPVFYEIQALAFGAVTASMIAYLTAQYCDVRLFHFWKWLTAGRHLWLRNNASTLVSQLVDTTAVILITHYLGALPVNASEPIGPQLITFIASGYVFKLTVALVDTGPLYVIVNFLRPYLGLQANEEIDAGDFEATIAASARVQDGQP